MSKSDPNIRLIWLIIGGLAIWGGLQSLGAYLFELDYRKPIIVYGFVGAFLSFWAIMLGLRSGRVARENEESVPKEKK